MKHAGLLKLRSLLLLLLLAVVAGTAHADDPPRGTRTTWRHMRTPTFTTSQGVQHHRCRDGLAVIGDAQELVCKFAYGPWDKDLEDEDVEVFVLADGEKTWRRLGIDRTGKDGCRDRERGIHDLGGWLVFEVPHDTRLPLGRHAFRAVVRGDGSAATGTLWVMDPGHAVAVFDIDGTLTIRDGELTKELAAASKGERYHPKIRPGAAEVARTRVAAGALPLYLSARPDRLTRRTRDWLTTEELPAGPLRLQSSVKGAVSTRRTQAYKEAVVRGLLERGLSVIAAYGNAVTDIDAYLGAGLDAALVFIVGKHRGEKGTMAVEDYGEHLKELEIRKPPSAGQRD